MALSRKAIDALPLGKDVEQVITDALQDWQGAIEWSIDHMADPPEDNLDIPWAISLIGNGLWACTVFFPPSFGIASALNVAARGVLTVNAVPTVYASASAAIKTASLLGAAIGSSGAQIAGMIHNFEGDLSSKNAKNFIHKFFVGQQSEIRAAYIRDADKYAQSEILNHLLSIGSMRGKWDPREDNDQAMLVWYNSAIASDELRKHVWNNYLFPGHTIRYVDGKSGIEDFFEGVIEKMRKDFSASWKIYQRYDTGGAGSYSIPPFAPRFNFDGLPPTISAIFNANGEKISNLLSNM